MAKNLREQFSENNIKFSLNLYSQVQKYNAGQNIIISPFSIKTCLALAYAGADGKTAVEILTGLHLISNDKNVVGESFKNVLDVYKDSPLLKIANKFYVKIGYQVKDEFNIVAKYFHSETENIQFEQKDAAAAKMNNWVTEKTKHKITNVIGPNELDSSTRMVMISAIYVKGAWKNKFEKHLTQKEDFWITESDSIKVDMMNNTKQFLYGELNNLDATALEMPYQNSNLSMLILLPKRKTGLADLEEKLKGRSLTSIRQNMHMNEVNVKFPKFRIEFQIELQDTFKKMGMESMFSDEANFSNLIQSDQPLKVSKLVHKAFIEVNEEGTEAFAVTCSVQIMMGIKPQPKPFFANRPFIYMIKDNEGNNFFMGRFVKN